MRDINSMGFESACTNAMTGSNVAQSEINLDALSVPELNQLIDDVEAALEGRKQGAKAWLIEEMREKAAQLGLDLGDLLDRSGPRTNVCKLRSNAGKAVVAKYRSPEGETWTGRGRMPRWLTEALHHGKSKESFAVCVGELRPLGPGPVGMSAGG
jgi:DNA-binding protein H-NS